MNLPVPHDPQIAIGEAVYSPKARALVVAEQEQRLEPRLAHLLETFCAHPGEVIERDTLLDEVWGDEGSDEALTQAVSRLRQLLGDRSLIQTEPRRGYRLVVHPREVAFEGTALRQVPASTRVTVTRDQRIFLAGLLAGIVLCALVAAILWPRPITVTHEITQEPGQEPVSSSSTCDGTVEECEGALDLNPDGS